jgi:hypothetical protein
MIIRRNLGPWAVHAFLDVGASTPTFGNFLTTDAFRAHRALHLFDTQ